MKQSKGFTLIELLVVIAIIGILSSIVLASLNTARERGADAAVKANLSGMRAEAELSFDTETDYDAVCTVVGSAVTAATGASSGTAVCTDDVNEWRVVAPLSDDDPSGIRSYWCTDYTGVSAARATVGDATTNGDIDCDGTDTP